MNKFFKTFIFLIIVFVHTVFLAILSNSQQSEQNQKEELVMWHQLKNEEDKKMLEQIIAQLEPLLQVKFNVKGFDNNTDLFNEIYSIINENKFNLLPDISFIESTWIPFLASKKALIQLDDVLPKDYIKFIDLRITYSGKKYTIPLLFDPIIITLNKKIHSQSINENNISKILMLAKDKNIIPLALWRNSHISWLFEVPSIHIKDENFQLVEEQAIKDVRDLLNQNLIAKESGEFVNQLINGEIFAYLAPFSFSRIFSKYNFLDFTILPTEKFSQLMENKDGNALWGISLFDNRKDNLKSKKFIFAQILANNNDIYSLLTLKKQQFPIRKFLLASKEYEQLYSNNLLFKTAINFYENIGEFITLRTACSRLIDDNEKKKFYIQVFSTVSKNDVVLEFKGLNNEITKENINLSSGWNIWEFESQEKSGKLEQFIEASLKKDKTKISESKVRIFLASSTKKSLEKLHSLIEGISTVKKLLDDKNENLNINKELNALIDELQNINNQLLEEKRKTVKDKTKISELSNKCDRLINLYSFFIWEQDYLKNVQPNSLPITISNETKEVSIKMAKNDTENISINITNLTNKTVPLRIYKEGQFNGNIILREALFRENEDKKIVGDPLPLIGSAGQIYIPPTETRQLFIQIESKKSETSIPNAQQKNIADNLNFKFIITPVDNITLKKEIKVNVLIYPFSLSETMPIATYNWDYALDEEYAKDLYNHKVNWFLVGTSTMLPEFDENANIIKINLDEHDKAIKYKKKYGKIMFSYGLIESFNGYVKNKYGWSFMDEKWQKGFENMMKVWINHLKELGLTYEDFAVQAWDEVNSEEAKLIAKAGALYRKIDSEIKWVMDGSWTLESVKIMDPFIDLWIPHIDHILDSDDMKEVMSYLRASKEPIWGYTCAINMPGLDPLTYYRLKPWLAYYLKLDGVAFWAYNSWRGDSWDADDYYSSDKYSDNGVVYKGPHGPITSRRWEAYKDGLEDYLYIYNLNKWLYLLPENEKEKYKLILTEIVDRVTKEIILNSKYKSINTYEIFKKELSKLKDLSFEVFEKIKDKLTEN